MAEARGKTLLWCELLGIFVALPIVFRQIHQRERFMVIAGILALAVYVGLVLGFDKSFDRASLWRWQRWGREWRIILTRYGLGVVVLALGMFIHDWANDEHKLFAFPLNNTRAWLMVMVLYPLLSVYPQELIFRAFFFHRYRPLLPGVALRVLVSAAAFGYAHVIYGHIISIVLTTVGGILFSLTYARTHSLLAACAEHAMYGCLIFTLGYGQWFYGGRAV